MNKTEAGFHLLKILSIVDGHTDITEEEVIVDYLEKNFEAKLDADNENDRFSKIAKEDYPIHFHDMASKFYEDSTSEERNKFLDFAMKVVIADKLVTRDENKYINELYDSWDIQ